MDELDAARECVMAVGVRRTTFSDVAQRAGISRMTLYRRHPDLASVLSALMSRDFGAIVADAQTHADHLPSGRERIVAGLIHTVEAMAASPLVRRLLELDPELLLPYVVDRLGETQHVMLDVMGRYIDEGQRDGSIRAGEPRPIAACLLLSARSFVFVARAREHACEPAAVLAELRTMVDAYLTPVDG